MLEVAEIGIGQQETPFIKSKEPVQSLESPELQKAAQKAIEKTKSPVRRILNYTERLLGADREASKPPTPEQLERLRRLSRILDHDSPEYRTILDRGFSWYMDLQNSDKTIGHVNELYQELSDSPKVDFRKDFPSIARRFIEDVKAPGKGNPPWKEIPGGSHMSAMKVFIDEYLEAQQKELSQAS